MKMVFFNHSIKILLLISILFANINLAQKVKIIKILDSNLFELADGRLIKLAGVDVPNINHKDINLQNVGIEAYKYAKSTLLKKRFELIPSTKVTLETNYALVHIIREYPLFTRDFTKEYLKMGIGKFKNNVDTLYFQKYLNTEHEAKTNRVGIWTFKNNYNNDTLDQTFLGAELLTENAIDSVSVFSFSQPFLSNTTQSGRILLEIVTGPLIGISSAFLGGAIGGGLGRLLESSDSDLLGYTILGGYIGYVTGTAADIFYIAKSGVRDVTFGYSILASFTGAAIGISLVYIGGYYEVANIPNYSLVVLPTIATIIYANLIAPKNGWEQTVTQSNLKHFDLHKTSLSHNDIYNHTKIFEISLFKINF